MSGYGDVRNQTDVFILRQIIELSNILPTQMWSNFNQCRSKSSIKSLQLRNNVSVDIDSQASNPKLVLRKGTIHTTPVPQWPHDQKEQDDNLVSVVSKQSVQYPWCSGNVCNGACEIGEFWEMRGQLEDVSHTDLGGQERRWRGHGRVLLDTAYHSAGKMTACDCMALQTMDKRGRK